MTHSSKLISSLFDHKNTLSSLITQSNKLAKLTGEACLIGENLKNVIFICNSEIMVTAFTHIVKGINPNVVANTVTILQYTQSEEPPKESTNNQLDVEIFILTDSNDVKAITHFKQESEKDEFDSSSKVFVIAPQTFHLSSLSRLNANIILSLESSADIIRDVFLQGIKGDKVTQGFINLSEDKCAKLTPRQKDVLELLCDGKSNKEISRDLNLAMGTIKVHIIAIFRELGVSNRTQAAMVLGSKAS